MSKTASKIHPIEVEATEQGPCLFEVSVQVPAARVSQEFDHTYKAYAQRIKVPGFRPGKVPVEVIRKRIGEENVLEDAREHLFEHIIHEALAQAGLQQLRLLDFDPSQYDVQEDADLAFQFRVESAPRIELPAWSEVEVEAQAVVPTEEQIDAAFEALGRDNPQFDEVDAGLDAEHYANADLAYFRGEDSGPTAEDLKLSLESPLYGAEPEAYRAALEGAKAGDEIKMPVEFHDGFTEAEWVGDSGEAVIQVKTIVKPRPGTPAEVAETVGMENEETLRERVVEGLSHDNEMRERGRQAFEILEALGRIKPFDLPERLVTDETEAALKSHSERLEKEGGMSAEEAAAQANQSREQLAEDSERRLRHYFLIRKVAEAEKVRVTEGDLDKAFRALAARHQADPKALRAYYDERNMTGDLARDILENKVREKIIGLATIAPAPGDS